MTNFIPLRPPGFTPPPQRAGMPDAKQHVVQREVAAADALWLGTQEAEALAGWREMLERASEAVADPQAPDLPEGLAGRVTRELHEDMTARLRTAPSEPAADALEARFAALGARETGTALRTERDLRRRRDTSQALDALEGLMGFAEARPEMLADVLASGAQVISGLSHALGPQEAQALQASFAGELPERVFEAVLARDPDRARALLDTPGLAAALGERAEPLRQAAETAQAHRRTAAGQAARARFETNLQALVEGRAAPLDVAELAGIDESERTGFAARQDAALRQNETVEQLLRMPPDEAEAELQLAAEEYADPTGRLLDGQRDIRPLSERRADAELLTGAAVPNLVNQTPGVVDHWSEWHREVTEAGYPPGNDGHFVLMNLFALEGGLTRGRHTTTVAGITNRMLNEFRRKAGIRSGVSSAQLNNSERIAFIRAMFDARDGGFGRVGGFDALVDIGDQQIALAVADAIYRFGSVYAIDRIVQTAINDALTKHGDLAADAARRDTGIRQDQGAAQKGYRVAVDRLFGMQSLRALQVLAGDEEGRRSLLDAIARRRIEVMSDPNIPARTRLSWQHSDGSVRDHDALRTDYLRFVH